MTYNEWRDELKNNLLSVSDGERRRVLDYYAEAYADRREAGFTEREIISDFGAPYDAAQRILCENDETAYADEPKYTHFDDSRESRREARRERCDQGRQSRCERNNRDEYAEPQSQSSAKTANRREDYTWVFVLLCVIFAGPLFGLVMTMVGVTIGLAVAPFGVLISGIAKICTGVGALISSVGGGFVQIGIGLIQTGIGVVLFPLCFWLIRIMWKLFKKLFRWIRSLFSGKEVA